MEMRQEIGVGFKDTTFHLCQILMRGLSQDQVTTFLDEKLTEHHLHLSFLNRGSNT